ncbi:vWA domain-containing protein [Gulosibacter chungangensis]|uniref:VWA domain-containing protein n=1 Tax=Gulosibacter chungangensis TaxID=979746 RepID=A0A7J5BBV1_9MICO|nr:VWA domain-containing protein [Gulosibacter chungangensis]KAB1643596.1 VWA domain-containing protein [Gulosibacter chungangensis]
MIFNPMLPVWLLVVIGAVLLGWVGYCLVRAPRRARMLWLGRGVMVLALIGALLRPGIGAVATEVADESVDVLFVVDTSASAAAEDWASSEPRLAGMQSDIASLAQQHPGARYSLVSFGSGAVQRLPFTTDVSALEHAVYSLQPEELLFASGTSIGAAAELVTEILSSAAREYPDRVRVVYYLGDGEQTADGAPESFADSADLLQGGAVLGYGTSEGGRMLEYDRYGSTGSYVRGIGGEEAISRIEEANLQDIAEQLEVPYTLRTAAEGPLAAEVDPGRGQSLDGAATQLTTFPLYWVFALIVLVFLLIEVWALGRAARELRDARELVE